MTEIQDIDINEKGVLGFAGNLGRNLEQNLSEVPDSKNPRVTYSIGDINKTIFPDLTELFWEYDGKMYRAIGLIQIHYQPGTIQKPEENSLKIKRIIGTEIREKDNNHERPFFCFPTMSPDEHRTIAGLEDKCTTFLNETFGEPDESNPLYATYLSRLP